MSSQFLRFGLVGLTATVTTYTVLIIGVERFEVNPVFASVIGYACGIVVNYLLNHRYTFSSKQRHLLIIPKFMIVMSVGMFINAGVMFVVINLFGFNYLLAQLAAVAMVFLWSFAANRHWAFAN